MKLFRWSILVIFIAAAAMVACTEDQGTRGTAENQPRQEERPAGTAQEGQPGQQSGSMAQREGQEGGQSGSMAQQQGQQGQPSGSMAQQQEGQASGQRQVEIAGKVEQTDKGFVIRSVNESYTVSGKDLSNMVGKDVRVTGTLEESNGRQTINVQSVSEIQ